MRRHHCSPHPVVLPAPPPLFASSGGPARAVDLRRRRPARGVLPRRRPALDPIQALPPYASLDRRGTLPRIRLQRRGYQRLLAGFVHHLLNAAKVGKPQPEHLDTAQIPATTRINQYM